MRWFRLAAEQENGYAQYLLAYMYEQGIGCNVDHKEAIKWLIRAADNEYSTALKTLGTIYYNGDSTVGIEKNYGKAVELFKQAAQQGDSDAINYLSQLGETW